SLIRGRTGVSPVISPQAKATGASLTLRANDRRDACPTMITQSQSRLLHQRQPRQRGDEFAAVGLGHDAAVQHDDGAAIHLAANQSPETLLELEDRLGQGILDERLAAARFDALHARFDER